MKRHFIIDEYGFYLSWHEGKSFTCYKDIKKAKTFNFFTSIYYAKKLGLKRG